MILSAEAVIAKADMVKQYYKAETYKARSSIAYLFRRGRSLLTSQIEDLFAEKFPNKDITFMHWVVLMCLRDDLARTPSEICQYLCHDTGAFTRVLDQMEERGLLKRQRSTADRRVVELSLTASGRKTVESVIALVVDFYNNLLCGFTKEEADTFVHLLTKFVNRVETKQGMH